MLVPYGRKKNTSPGLVFAIFLLIEKHFLDPLSTCVILMLRYTYGYGCRVLQDKCVYYFQEEVVQHQQARRNEKNSGGGLRIMKYCWPPWLVDKKILRFKSPKTAKKT